MHRNVVLGAEGGALVKYFRSSVPLECFVIEKFSSIFVLCSRSVLISIIVHNAMSLPGTYLVLNGISRNDLCTIQKRRGPQNFCFEPP